MSPRDARRRAFSEALEDLERYRRLHDEASFLGSRDAQRMVLQALYVAVQAAIDEANAVIAARGLTAPDRYRDAFPTLAQAGLLDAQLAAKLADWASFRNILAHFYPVVDPTRVFAALSDVDDLQQFRDWLEEQRA